MEQVAIAERIQMPSMEMQEYARSLTTLWRLGEIATRGCEVEEVKPIEELAYDDFNTSVVEMLKTDKEFRNYLDVDSIHTYEIHDGKVCAADGTPIVTVIGNGITASRERAAQDPRMKAQVVRDQGDLENAQKVDQLKPGTARFVLSMDPKEQLAKDPKFWEDLGYREGIAYLQWYCKVDESTLLAGAYSVDMSDESAWRQTFAELEITVPEDESPNTWIRHAYECEATPEEAQAFGKDVRKRHYRNRGTTHDRHSVSEYVEAKANKNQIDNMFNHYYPSLSKAIYEQENNEAMQTFAQALLSDTAEMDPKVRSELLRIANSSKFTDNSGRLMDSLIRYAAVEELRKGLSNLVSPKRSSQQATHSMGHVQNSFDPGMMHTMMAANVHAGVNARRSYGGCAGQTKLNREDSSDMIDGSSPQDAFGGKGNDSESGDEESGTVACEYVHDGCYCCSYNEDGSPSGTKFQVRARRNKEGIAECLRRGCGAQLAKNGKCIDIGGIAKKAQEWKSGRLGNKAA